VRTRPALHEVKDEAEARYYEALVEDKQNYGNDLFPVDEEGVDGDDVDNDMQDVEQFTRERHDNHCVEQHPDWIRLRQFHHVLLL